MTHGSFSAPHILHGTVIVTASGLQADPPVPDQGLLRDILFERWGQTPPPEGTPPEEVFRLLTHDTFESILESETDPVMRTNAEEALVQGYTAVLYAYAVDLTTNTWAADDIAVQTGAVWRDIFAAPLSPARLERMAQQTCSQLVREALADALPLWPHPLVSEQDQAWGTVLHGLQPVAPHLRGPVTLSTNAALQKLARHARPVPAHSFPAQWIELDLGPGFRRAMQGVSAAPAHLALHVADLPTDEARGAFPPAAAAIRCVSLCAAGIDEAPDEAVLIAQAWQAVDAGGRALGKMGTLLNTDNTPGAQQLARESFARAVSTPLPAPTARTARHEPVTDLRPATPVAHVLPEALAARLNQHAGHLKGRYPHVWKRMPDLHQRGAWPPFTFLPLADVARLMAEHEDLTDEAVLHDVMSFMTVGTWRVTRGVYRIDETLLDALWNDTAPPDEVPLDQLQHLPEWCTYVPLPGRQTAEGEGVYGVFATYTPEQVILTFDLADGTLHHEIVDTATGSLKAMVRLDAQEDLPADLRGTAAGTRHGHAEFLANVLNVLLYLCSVDADLPSRPAAGSARKGKRLNLAQQVQAWDVGVRMGAALRQAAGRAPEAAQEASGEGRRVRPHLRRAHFHRFRYGPMSLGDERPVRLRWLPSIPVKLDLSQDEDHPVVIRPLNA